MADKYTQKRLIAIFDIIGFKERVKENSHKIIYDELKKIKDNLKTDEMLDKFFIKADKVHAKKRGLEPPIKKSVIQHLLFSDTILFISDDVDFGLISMIHKSKQLVSHCLKNEIPIKGCIATGDVSYNKTDDIIFGKPIIDAFLLAEEMKFMGIILDRSMEENIELFRSIDYNHYVLYDKVPLKSGKINHYYIELKDTWKLENFTENHDEEVYKGIKKMYQSVNSGPRQYYDNTLDLFFKDFKPADKKTKK